MADAPATQPAGPETIQSVPAPTQVEATTAPQEQIELTQEAVAAGFTKDDFAHPQYGPKAKNLYQGFQKATETASKAKKDMDEVNHRLTLMYQSDPEVKRAIDGYVKKMGGETTAETLDEPEGADTRKLNDQMAFNNFYAHLGAGDPVKGQELFGSQQPEYKKVFDSFYGKDMLQALLVAKELVTLRAEAQKTRGAAAPQAQPATNVQTAGESGRGTATNPAGAPAKSISEAADRWARSMGFADYNEWSRASISD